jgi:DNA-binding XRE family transcriptional regulator
MLTTDELQMVADRAAELADTYERAGYAPDRALAEAVADLRRACEECGQGLELRQAVPDGASPDEEVAWRVLPTAAEWERIAELARWAPARIRALRERLGLSQEALARRVGATTSTVARWEQGVRRPGGSARKMLDMLSRGTYQSPDPAGGLPTRDD